MSDNKDEKSDLNFLESYKTYAIIFLAAVILTYLFTKVGLQLEVTTTGDMGAVGDFFGGILNPIFALIGLFALLRTIQIQTKELNASREELELTRDEIGKSRIAQEEQSQSIKQQNFENTFFNMIDLHNQNIDNLVLMKMKKNENVYKETINASYTIGTYEVNRSLKKRFINQEETKIEHDQSFSETPLHINYPEIKISDLEKEVFDDKDYYNKKALSRLLIIFKKYLEERDREFRGNHEELYNHFHDEYEEIIGHYFGTIYQVLKFINESYKESKIDNPNRYAHLFRSQFSKHELELLFYHGCGEIGKQRFLQLLVQFEFFEHISYSADLDEEFIRTYVNYDKGQAFGKNIDWILERIERAKPN